MTGLPVSVSTQRSLIVRIESEVPCNDRPPSGSRDGIRDKIDADRKQSNGRGRNDNRPWLDRHPGTVLADHGAPIRRWRGLAEPEIAERAEKDDSAGKPDADISGDRQN